MKRIHSLLCSFGLIFSLLIPNFVHADSYLDEVSQKNGVMPDFDPIDRHDVSYERYKIGVSPKEQVALSYGAPSAVQAILQFHDVVVNQEQLAKELGTDQNGTPVQNIAPVLNKYLGWNAYPKDGEPGYRIGQIRSSVGEDLELFWKRVEQSYQYKDPMIYLVNMEYLYNYKDNNFADRSLHYNSGIRYVLSNGYRYGHKKGSPTQDKFKDIIFFDTSPKGWEPYYHYEKAFFYKMVAEAIVQGGGYYIW